MLGVGETGNNNIVDYVVAILQGCDTLPDLQLDTLTQCAWNATSRELSRMGAHYIDVRTVVSHEGDSG